jgi:hypothetical protein
MRVHIAQDAREGGSDADPDDVCDAELHQIYIGVGNDTPWD